MADIIRIPKEYVAVIVGEDNSIVDLYRTVDSGTRFDDLEFSISEDGSTITIKNVYTQYDAQFISEKLFWSEFESIDVNADLHWYMNGIEEDGNNRAQMMPEVSMCENLFAQRARAIKWARMMLAKQQASNQYEGDGYNDTKFTFDYEDDFAKYRCQYVNVPAVSARYGGDDEWDDDVVGYYYEPRIVTAVRYTPKRLPLDFIRKAQPLDTPGEETGDFRVVKIYGKEFVTKLYSNGDDVWWFNPYAGKNGEKIVVNKITLPSNIGGRAYDTTSDPAYSEALDPALHPEIIALSDGEDGTGLEDFWFGESGCDFPWVEDIGDFEITDADGNVVQDGGIVPFRLTPYRRTSFPITADGDPSDRTGVAKNYLDIHDTKIAVLMSSAHDWSQSSFDAGYKLYACEPEVEKVVVLPRKGRDVDNCVIWEKGAESFTYAGPGTLYLLKQMLYNIKDYRPSDTALIKYILPDDIKGKLSALMKDVNLINQFNYYPIDFSFVVNPLVLTPIQKFNLFKTLSDIKEIRPENDDDLQTKGEFWVADGKIYAASPIYEKCVRIKHGRSDDRFNEYEIIDPNEYKVDHNLTDDEFNEMIDLIRNNEKNKVNTTKLFPSHKDHNGHIVYDIPEQWVIDLVNRIITKLEDEMLVCKLDIAPEQQIEKIRNRGISIKTNIRFSRDVGASDTSGLYDNPYGISSADKESICLTMIANNDPVWEYAKANLPTEALAKVAICTYVENKGYEDGASFHKTLTSNDSDVIPAGSTLIVALSNKQLDVSYDGTTDTGADPMPVEYYVEYTPELDEDTGNLIVNYVVKDANGNDVTDQVETVTFDEYALLKG